MGCSCKEVKKIGRKYPIFLREEYNKKGIGKIISVFGDLLIKMLKNVIVVFLFIIGIPFVASMLIYNFCKKGDFIIDMPFMQGQKNIK